MIAKGDRDYATAVDIEIERVIREALREVDPESPSWAKRKVLAPPRPMRMWVLDPIDGTVNFSKASPLCGISLASSKAVSRRWESSTSPCSASATSRAMAWGRL